jgi:hypothetical protein
MKKILRVLPIAGAAFAVSACVIAETNYDPGPGSSYDPGPGSSPSRQATSAAESACMSAVNSQYGGDVESVRVIRSEYSEANSLVMVSAVRDGSSERWRCLSSNDGEVADLSID